MNDIHLHTPTVAQLLKKFNAFYETRKYISLSTIDHSGTITVKRHYFSIKTGSPIYRVIHKSLRDFRPLRYSSRDYQAQGEPVNRGRDTPSFCPTLRVLYMSTLDDAADVNSVIKFLPHTCNVYRTDICCVSKGRHIEYL